MLSEERRGFAGTELQYMLVDQWERLPPNLHHDDVSGVSVDSEDRVYILTRREERVIVYSSGGEFLNAWGDGFFSPMAHGLTVSSDGSIYCVDVGHDVVFRFTVDGRLVQTIGTLDVASNTGYDGLSLKTIVRSGPPFNKPTNLAISPQGELYVSDGYGNARVHRFSRSGELIQSWGEPGSGPGQFNLVHGIAVALDGTVYVADRENDRIQLFSPEGDYIAEWDHVQRPTNIVFDAEGRVYVSELGRRSGDESMRLGPVLQDQPGRVSVYDPTGKVVARLGGSDRCTPGNFIAPHDIAVDSLGNIYVAEVSWTYAVSHGYAPEGACTLQKFSPALAWTPTQGG